MSLFMIETSAVDSGASNVGKLASQVTSLSSSVSGYDVSCNGEFDFESVKNTIVSNLEACVTKISNTSTILNAVSEINYEYVRSQLEKLDDNYMDYMGAWCHRYYRSGFSDGMKITSGCYK